MGSRPFDPEIALVLADLDNGIVFWGLKKNNHLSLFGGEFILRLGGYLPNNTD